MSTYTQTPGSALGNVYFEDVEISPVTVADGTLRHRFDTHLYPKLGTVVVENRGLPGVTLVTSNAAPVHANAFTLTATVHTVTAKPGHGTVTFMDGVTVLGTAPVSGTTAVLAVVAGVAVGVHNVTAVYGGTTSAAVTVTAS